METRSTLRGRTSDVLVVGVVPTINSDAFTAVCNAVMSNTRNDNITITLPWDVVRIPGVDGVEFANVGTGP